MSTFKIRSKVPVNKLDHSPFFTKILNWKGDKFSIEGMLQKLLEQFTKDADRLIVEDKLKNLTDDYLNEITKFQQKFRQYMLQTISSQNVSEEFLLWLGNSYKYLEESVELYVNDETRSISIKEASGRWFEALACYNFIMTFNYFGVQIIKVCPICSTFFSHKGKYAKYCSDGCKETGMKKKG